MNRVVAGFAALAAVTMTMRLAAVTTVRLKPATTVRLTAVAKAMAVRRSVPRRRKPDTTREQPELAVDPSLYSELRWRHVGPFRGGRTVGAAGVVQQPNVFYIGVNNGGVWKTTDYGLTWTPLFDEQGTQSIGTVAVAPSDPNVVYAGSGEGLQRPDLSVGDGVYKSTDAGRTWQHLGLREARQIAAIVVDPHDPNRLFVAALGHPYGANVERGVFRSTDGGRTFDKVLYKDENTGAIDVAFDPADAQTIYAAMWAARQGPWEYNNAYVGPTSGLFKSSDGGATWQPLTRGLPAAAEGLSRIGIGIAPSEPRRIYAWVTARTSALYRSDDAGASWTQINTEARVWGRGDDFANVRVDPVNPDIVYAANTSTYRSSDGGRTFTAIKGAPGGDDYHTIWINPTNPRIILIAADQGATITVNGGETWSSWYNQPTAQMFHVAADNRFPYWLYGGQQESGSAGVASRSDYGEITFREWHPVGVEEYGYAAPDPLHPGIVYGGKVTRYDERSGDVQQVGPIVVRDGQDRFVRTAPILFSAADPHVLLYATQFLYKTINGGRSWTKISGDLSRATPGVPPSLGVYATDAGKNDHRGVIYAIGPSPLNVNVIWTGSDDGAVHVTRDGGVSWADVTPPDVTAWSKVTQIDASHFDQATAYISVSRFRVDDLTPLVFRTRDSGKSWTRITRGLADNASINVVREDPKTSGLLFAGSEREVSVSFDAGDSWQPITQNLPHTSVRDLIVHGDDVAIATHGRGFWILDNITPLRQMVRSPERLALLTNPRSASLSGERGSILFTPAVAYRLRRNQNTDTPLPPEVPAGQNPPDGAMIDYYLAADARGPVTLEITSASRTVVRRYSSADPPEPYDEKSINVPMYWARPPRTLPASKGMHRFVWDLRSRRPGALQRDFPISAVVHDTPLEPLGVLAVPGTYTVKLTVDGKTFVQPITVKMDPRATITALGLAQQFTLATKIVDLMDKTYAAATSLTPEGARVQEAQGSRRRGELEALNADLATAYDAVEGSDRAPTPQASRAVTALEQRARRLLNSSAK